MIKSQSQNPIQKQSNQSIKKLLQRKWLNVILALILTGFGAALTGILFKTGIHALEDYRSNLLRSIPRWIFLAIL
jgi:CIC family chloride channel protein